MVEAGGAGCKITKTTRLVFAPELTNQSLRFIIDGIITLPIAVYGFLIFPDVPATTTAFYLTEEVRK